jgi:hypothetical protein
LEAEVVLVVESAPWGVVILPVDFECLCPFHSIGSAIAEFFLMSDQESELFCLHFTFSVFSPSTENRVESYTKKQQHHGRFIGVNRRSSAKRQQIDNSH